MKKIDVVLGLQWGDEGKGKVVDVLTPDYQVIARFQGGPNAGHSLHFEGKKYVLHTIPSGIFRDGSINIIGNGVVIDPVILSEEIAKLEKDGVDVQGKLLISKKAHLILPTHRIIDAASEASKGKTKIGSTLKGIGPTYMDKTGRNGLRVGDIVSGEFEERYGRLKEKHIELLKQYDFPYDICDYEKEWLAGIENLKRFRFIDSEHVVNSLLQEGKAILAEGAQGSMLDIDFGTYPFVTSSNPTAGGACTGTGVGPTKITRVIGVSKAYVTRVGEGPFPTELFDEDGEKMRQIGQEFGATTGRPRRCGWLDLVILRYAVRVNGLTGIALNKLDTLTGLKELKVCVGYDKNGEVITDFPADIHELDKCTPIYETLPGWTEDITKAKKPSDLPEAAMNYIRFIEKQIGCPVELIGVGPDRTQSFENK